MFINVSLTKHLRLLVFLILFLYIININAYKEANDDDDDDFIDVGVRLVGGKRDSLIADLIAEERNVLNAGLIDGVDLYHYHIRRKRNHRSKRAIDEAVEDLKRDERIEFVTVGERVEREKRGFISDEQMMNLYKKNYYQNNQQKKEELSIKDSHIKMTFNDDLYSKQWYLENEGQLNTPKHHDINVRPAWSAGYSGVNVSICIVDDGVDHPHPELFRRYRSDLSYDLNDLDDPDHDPLPRTYDSENNHGTRCAGAAAAEANNKKCGVGVAPGAFIAGIRVLDGSITTLLEARGLTMYAANTHIKSASWGPPDDGKHMEAPGSLVNAAFNHAVTKGRGGKGTLFVWASGNGGANSDDCGADGYVSHQNIISIGSINHLGKTTYFDEACPSTMAVAYTGGQHAAYSHEENLSIGVVAPDVGGKCTTSFYGTSGAAPVAAGAFALVLEANPDLGYRDVMHIVARTARIPNLAETDGWLINGGGFHVNDKFGFGVIDVGQMVSLAQTWTNVDARHECYFESKDVPRKLVMGAVIEISIEVPKCESVASIEHVVANVSYVSHRRGDVKITLISPSQTPSEMLSFRDNDADNKGIRYFPFLSVHHWGESPIGRWILRIETRKPQTPESKISASSYDDLSEIGHFGLRIYGSNDPDEKNGPGKNKRAEKKAFIPTAREIKDIYNDEIEKRETPNIMQKRDHENILQQKRLEEQKKRENLGDRSFLGFIRRALGF